jgi:hypothetical protein
MRKTALVLSIASALTLGASAPTFAADDKGLGSIASFFGSITAVCFDVPTAMVVDTFWRVPLKTERTLAEKFGNEKGFQQNVAATVIGVPVGMVWGVPAGFLRGAKHGMGTGWEKPFSTESFLVGMGEDK